MSDYKSPVNLLMSTLKPYGVQIMTCDENFFKKSQYVGAAESMSGRLGLIDIWDSVPDETKEAIWSYLQHLYVLGMKASVCKEELELVITQITS